MMRQAGTPKSLCLLALVLSLVPLACATPVLKMPAALPDIVREYKSVVLYGYQAGMQDTGVRVQKGDLITLVAKGEILYDQP